LEVSCAVGATGNLACWGSSAIGLGDGSQTRLRPTPIPGMGPGTWTDIAVGNSFICGVHGASLFCWGDNAQGALASGDSLSHATPFASPTAPGTWASPAAGQIHACGISNGNVMCWGGNFAGGL